MKKLFSIIVMYTLATPAYPQNDCNCEKALGNLIATVESSYPGFAEKTTDKLIYNNFKENLKSRAPVTKSESCTELLKEYVSFFRDGHISVFGSANETAGSEGSGANSKINMDRAEFEKMVKTTKDPMVGIWTSLPYKVGIIPHDSGYIGFIIEADTSFWKPNEIKFRLYPGGKADFYLRDHSLSRETYTLNDGWFLRFARSNYIKVEPGPALSEKEFKSKLDEFEGFYFRRLTPKTSLLCISSFEHGFLERIKQLIDTNRTAIESCENLIIDIRNNGGGVYEGYATLLPLIMTNPIRGLGMEFFVTQTLIDEIESWYDDEAGKQNARMWKNKFAGKTGQFVNPDSIVVYTDSIKPSLRSPRQVVILVNRGTASSGEAFVLDARQSKKVKVLGTPTYGALDYGSAAFFSLGCSNYRLMLPTWRSARLPGYPVDNIGLQPDIYLDKSVSDWVKFSVGYLEGK
jgi:hypothetical protein